MPTDREPKPKIGLSIPPPRAPDPTHRSPLPRTIRQPEASFLDVIQARRSRIGGEVGMGDLSSLLWHSTVLRERRMVGRFGIPWESRPTPSAGGLHAIRILVLPLYQSPTAGEYVPEGHALAPIDLAAIEANRASVAELLGPIAGTTLQFAYDVELLEACYEHANTLMWRDAGALATTVCLVATWLGLTSVVLGRTGDTVVRKAGLTPGFVGVGAVHIGTTRSTEAER